MTNQDAVPPLTDAERDEIEDGLRHRFTGITLTPAHADVASEMKAAVRDLAERMVRRLPGNRHRAEAIERLGGVLREIAEGLEAGPVWDVWVSGYNEEGAWVGKSEIESADFFGLLVDGDTAWFAEREYNPPSEEQSILVRQAAELTRRGAW